jgi:hypothetical protein
MILPRPTHSRIRGFAVAACLALAAAFTPTLWSRESTAAAPPPKTASTPSSTTNAPAPEITRKTAKRHLTGAELYSIHCNRCHPERYPTERTAAQWKTIMLHMQVRANLPVEQARMILKYLQENSGR